MNVLVVGAGALGQPFGYHLHRGGANLAYSVKPKHREACEQGFTLHRYRMFGRIERIEFDDFDLFTDYDSLEEGIWDQVWICVSSPAIRGDWLPELLEAVGPTTLVSIQPGLEDRDYLESLYPADRIVSARVSIIAWETPLADEDLPAGDIAYFIPPAQPVYVGGAMQRAPDVAALLDRGGCPSQAMEDVLAYGAFSSAVLEPAVAALETAGWSLHEFRTGSALQTAARAASEALAIVGAKHGVSVPWSIRAAARPLTLRLGMPLLAALVPFDLEDYLEEHFTKVGDQTREELVDYIEAGEEAGLSVGGLRKLSHALPE